MKLFPDGCIQQHPYMHLAAHTRGEKCTKSFAKQQWQTARMVKATRPRLFHDARQHHHEAQQAKTCRGCKADNHRSEGSELFPHRHRFKTRNLHCLFVHTTRRRKDPYHRLTKQVCGQAGKPSHVLGRSLCRTYMWQQRLYSTTSAPPTCALEAASPDWPADCSEETVLSMMRPVPAVVKLGKAPRTPSKKA